VSGKLFAQCLARLPPGLWPLLFACLLGSTTACRGRRALTRPAAVVDRALGPERFAAVFAKLGRAHLRAVARFEAGPEGAAAESVSTETDLWMDDLGNWRLVELNDKDGGREIVRHGRELAVALRYGKMIRRAAEDPEPERLLQEGVGASFAAWDLLRDVTTVDDFGTENRGGRQIHIYKLTKARRPPDPATNVDPTDRRAWRRTLVAGTVDGTVAIDDATGLPLQVEIRAKYTMRRNSVGGGRDAGGDTGTPMQGAVEVRASIEEIGSSPRIARPEGENLPLRQRTVPEEKALLGGLPRMAPPLRGAP
jgi:hypothetical protein